jgi:hypothetical protein
VLRRRRRSEHLFLARREVANILRFEVDFPGAAIIRLEQNTAPRPTSSPPPPV